MIEIPNGTICGGCRYVAINGEGGYAECQLFDPMSMSPDDYEFGTYLGYDVVSGGYFRCPACLSAYLNGATVTITPKEAIA